MFKNGKYIILILISILFVSMIFMSSSVQAEEVVLKLAHGNAIDHPMHQGVQLFAKLVEEKTNGAVKVDIFPANQLGNNREMFEGVMAGTIDICITGINYPDIIGLPFWSDLYFFRNQRHAYLFLQSPIMKPLIKELEEEAGVTIIETAWFLGVRNLTCNKAIYTPSDLKGVKIRVPESPSYIETLKGMGATPTPIAFAELYTSLKSGVIDGQENPFIQIYISKFYETQKYLMLTSHLVDSNGVFMNLAKLNSLTPQQQQIIHESIYEAARFQDKIVLDSNEDYLNKLKEEGMTVIEPDMDAFAKSIKEHFYKNVFTPEEIEFYEKMQSFGKL